MTHFIPQLTPQANLFPAPHLAMADPDGLLAFGGDLAPARLLAAYQQGIFPWYSAGEPILWWSPSQRATLAPDQVHISKSMAKLIRQDKFEITINVSFTEVIAACADRGNAGGTWITDEMQQAYIELHRLGHAHSIEVWHDQALVGGLYGMGIGQLFCGESMFHHHTDASKIAFVALCQHFQQHGGQLIDAQIPNPHLDSLGVTAQSRASFLTKATQLTAATIGATCWTKQTIHLKGRLFSKSD